MNGPIILKKYRYSLWIDKFKGLVLVYLAWAIICLILYTPFAVLIIGTPWDWEAFWFVYMCAFVSGGVLFSFGIILFTLRGMYNWIEDWYIVKSKSPVLMSPSAVRIHSLGHWLTILKYGYAGEEGRLLVFDGFEGRRYYFDNSVNRNWHYDDYTPSRWQYPH